MSGLNRVNMVYQAMGGEKNFFLKKTKKNYFRLVDKGQRWGEKTLNWMTLVSKMEE